MQRKTFTVCSTSLALFYREIVSISALLLFWKGGWGGGGGNGRVEEYTTTRKGLKRSTLIKDTDPLFRDLEDNQIEELSPGVFDNNTKLVSL